MRPDHGLDVRGAEGVSIHAPARGATMIAGKAMQEQFKFQFTHPRGARLEIYFGYDYPGMFQFTHPRGVRREEERGKETTQVVSIHAPARGATTGKGR